jgi:hypothetical protein
VAAVLALTACSSSGPETAADRPASATAPTSTAAADPAVESPPTTAVPIPVAPITVAPSTTATTTTPQAPLPAPAPPEPVSVQSAAIGLTSTLVHVGLQADDGGVEVPDFPVAGWYRYGSRPGQAGPTVIVGHVDSRDGPAVFFRLRDLRPGDTVDVGLSDGSIATYEVVGAEQFPKAEFPTFAVFGATPDDVLRLVTCTGEFNRDIRSYYDNLVVTARRVA